jgi:hypothetical protein
MICPEGSNWSRGGFETSGRRSASLWGEAGPWSALQLNVGSGSALKWKELSRSAFKWKEGSGSALKWKEGSGSGLKWKRIVTLFLWLESNNFISPYELIRMLCCCRNLENRDPVQMADDQFLRLVLKDQAAFQFLHLKGTVAWYVF